MRDLHVIFRGKPVFTLSENLIIKQNLSDEEIEAIKIVHQARFGKIELMQTLDPTDKKALHVLRDEITELDFQLQELWKFGRNLNFHRFFDLPHCRCPKMDNQDSLGTDYRVIAFDCPLHT